MNDLRKRLTEHDPLASEPLPDAIDFERMRRAAVAESLASARPANQPGRRAWLAIAAIAMLAVLGAQRLRQTGADSPPQPAAPVHTERLPIQERTPARRQVRFVTARGTRVIWILNEEFEAWSQR